MRKIGETVIAYSTVGLVKVSYMVDSRGKLYFQLPWGQIVKDSANVGSRL